MLVDPDRLLNGGWEQPTHYVAVDFTCEDCGVRGTWSAESQKWYYETTGGIWYGQATRCRPCRAKERERKRQARIAAGHEKPDA